MTVVLVERTGSLNTMALDAILEEPMHAALQEVAEKPMLPIERAALNNPELEKPISATDDEIDLDPEERQTEFDDHPLIPMFADICRACNLAPVDALALLSKQPFDDDSNIVSHIRAGF
ncbi:MAG: hypothetical protein JWQ42_1714 [Edaphobacter sp.]|nr:hypothetical protein [Edaphobacter sp.]